MATNQKSSNPKVECKTDKTIVGVSLVGTNHPVEKAKESITEKDTNLVSEDEEEAPTRRYLELIKPLKTSVGKNMQLLLLSKQEDEDNNETAKNQPFLKEDIAADTSEDDEEVDEEEEKRARIALQSAARSISSKHGKMLKRAIFLIYKIKIYGVLIAI